MRLAVISVIALALAGAVFAIAARPSAAREAADRLTSLRDCGPVIVDFDDLPTATVVAEQYAPRGVHFLDDASTTPLIYSNSAERTTSSPPNSLTNDADAPGTSANVPLTLTFDQPQAKVGFYIGNGTTDGTPTATLTAYDAGGAVIGTVATRVPDNNLTQFFGISISTGGIRKVTLDYGDTVRSEEIDDLCFAAPAPVTSVSAIPYRAALIGFEPRILFQYDLAIHGMELTQAIQCFNTAAGLGSCADNSLPLVLDKSTAARIYLKYSSILATQAANIPVRFWYRVAGGAWSHVDLTGTAKATLSQLNADDSTNVFFSAFGGSSLNTEFYAEVDPNNTMAEANEANNRYPASGVISITFSKRRSFSVVGRSVHYHPGGYGGTQDPAGWAITGGGATWWNQLLPLKNNAISYSLASGSKDWTTTLDTSGQHALIGSLNYDWLWDNTFALLFGGGGPFTFARHVYGWTPNSGFSGGHADMPIYPHAGGWGIVGIGTDAPGTSTDNPGKGAIVLGHELTHDYNVKHTNTADGCGSSDDTTDFPYSSSSIQEVGFNPITGKIYDPATTHDLMSYCPPGTKQGWISPFTWNKMFGSLTAFASYNFATRALEGAESLVVNATLFRDGGGEFGTLERLPIASPFPPVEIGQYQLVLKGVDGEVRGVVPFSVDFQGEESVGEFAGLQPEATRQFTIPFPDGTSSIELQYAGKVLDERRVSPNVPAVQISSASPRLLEWNATDEDGDALTFSVFYSHDGGASWQLLASELHAMSLALDPDRLAGSPDARFRVVASDGVNTGVSDLSDAVQIPNKPPIATIMDPADGKRVPAGSLVVLLGTALDLEDGTLGDGSLAWSGSASGTGSTLPVTLTEPGVHTFTLTARDSDGATGEATVHVLVGSVDTPIVTPSPSSVGQAVVGSARAHGVGAGASCTVDYGDGSGALAGAMSGDVCTGPAHVYTVAGTYPVVVVVNDAAGEVGTAGTHTTVTAAAATTAFVTAGGWVSAGGAKVEFGLSVRWRGGDTKPTGQTTVQLPAGALKATGFEWLTVDGGTVRFLGHATVAGVAGYDFLAEATDAATDAFRIRVWKAATGEPVFDGGGPLGGGSVVLHK